MKVLHVLYQSLPNTKGSSIRSRDIVLSQREIGIEPIVLSSPFQPPLDLDKDKEYIDQILYYRTFNGNSEEVVSEKKSGLLKRVKKLFQIFPFILKTVKIAKIEKVDIIHAHATFFTAISAKIASIIIQKPFIYEVRSLWEERQKTTGNTLDFLIAYLISMVETISMKSADKIVVINKNLHDNIVKRGIASDRIYIIPNAVNTKILNSNMPSLEKKKTDEITFGYIGSISSIEGLDSLCEVFLRLKVKGYTNKLIIYGAGPELLKLERYIDMHKLDNIKLMGSVPASEIITAYNAIDVIINPRVKSKLTDTVTPLKPLEAMFHKKLIIATDIGGMKELINNRITGILYKHDNINELEKIIIDIIDNKNNYLKIIRNGYENILKNRNWSENAKKYNTIYNTLLTKC